MNQVYRIVWNAASGVWQVAAETARGRGKSKASADTRRRVGLALGLLAGAAHAQGGLPAGGNVVAGNGTISQAGNVLTVQQSSSKLAIDWQNFSVGTGNTVNFVQPSSSAVALNRVLGSDVSVIQGAINSNGQVFLINPNGVLFTPTAQVNVGGLVASTLNMSTADFMDGNYKFAGDSGNAVTNQGRISAANGGTIALVAARITNSGTLDAEHGNVLLGAGSRVTLDLGGPVKIQVEQGALDALIEQGGGIKADGGLVYLTAKGAGELMRTVINHTGITEAQTLATGEQGQIYLMGGMQNDHIAVGGTLDASAPKGGDGGFIETSAAKVALDAGRVISTRAASGKTGTWLIDPNDYTIAASGGDITGAQLSGDLASTNVTISTATQGTTGGNGDILVNDAIAWGTGNTLTLNAERNIAVNSQITHASGSGDLVLRSDSNADGAGVVKFADPNTRYIDFSGSSGNLKLYYNPFNANATQKYTTPTNYDKNIAMGGGALAPSMLINNATDLKNFLSVTVFSKPAQFGFAALGADIDPGAMTTLSSGGYFRGVFDGDGHKISHMDIQGSGLFNYTVGAVLKNLTLDETNKITITGRDGGAFVATARNSVFENLVNKAALSVAPVNHKDIGGIAGTFTDGTMINVANYGDLNLGNNPYSAGGVASRIENSSLYRIRNYGNLSSSDTQAPDNYSHTVGGIAGTSVFTTFADVINSGNLSLRLAISDTTLQQNAIGGISGRSWNDNGMSYVVNHGTISATTDGTVLVGGIAGWINGTTAKVQVNDLYSESTFNLKANKYVNGTNANLYVGALFGLLDAPASVSNKNSIANTIAQLNYTLDPASTIPQSYQYTAGLVGYLGGYTALSNSYWNVSGPLVYTDAAYASGPYAFGSGSTKTNTAAKTLAELQAAGSYDASWAAWDVAGGTVPTLKPVVTAYSDPVIKQYDGQAYSAAAAAAHMKYVGGTSADATGSATLGGTFAAATAANTWTDFTTTAYAMAVGGLNPASSAKTLVQANEVFKINPRLVTATADNKAMTYGDAEPGLTWQITSGSLVGSDTLGGSLTRSAGNNAGSYTIQATGLTASPNYLLTSVNGTLSIARRPITVTLDNQAKTYGDADPALTWQVTNGSLVGSDRLAGSATRTAGNNVGAYTISGSGLTNNNYQITVVNGRLTISQRPITVTADSLSKTYGDADPALSWHVTSGSLVGSDKLSGSLSRAAGENVGQYAISAGSLANGNYLITVQNGTLNIDPRPITVTADALSKTYGDADPALTWRVTSGSLVRGDTLDGALTRAAGENAGTYVIDASSLLANGNYVLTKTNGTLTIDPRPITVTADAKSKTYGEADPALTWRLTSGNLVGGDTLSGNLTRAGGENAGSYVIDTACLLANGNYIVTHANGTLTIDPRPITVTADAKSKTYGDADPALTWRVTAGSLIDEDTLSGSLSRAAGENAGQYAIGAGTLGNGNYRVTVQDGTLTIDPRPITVTADAKSKTYGDADPALSWRVTSGSLVAGDSLNGSLSRTAGENVGQYAIGAGSLANGNYRVTVQDGTLTIDPRPITVTADAKSKTYGDADPALTWRLTSGSLVGSDTLNGVLTRAAGENAGQYAITGTLANGNYRVTVQDGTLRIDPRPITVAADLLTKTYGDADPALTWRLTSGSLVGSDTLSGALTRAAGENAGSYVIDASSLLANANYTVTRTNGTLTIDPRPIAVTADAKSKTYGDADPALTWHLTSGNLVGSDTLSGALTRAAGENAGSYVIDASSLLANGNYVLTKTNGTLTIDPRPLTVTADAKSKTYGEADPALTWRLTSGNLVGSDSLSGSLSRAAGENAGQYAIGAGTLGNGNYRVTVQDGTLTIDPRPITVTADALSKTYGDADPALTWRLTSGSLVAGDTLGGSLSRTAGENVGQYAVGAGNLGNGNYRVTVQDGTLRIDPRPITVTADTLTKTYGDADPALTWRVTGGNLVGGDTLNGALTRAAGENAGQYAISAGALANGNYAVTVQNGTLTIDPRPITVTADTKSKTYGDADPALTWHITSGSLVGGDSLSGSLSRAPGENAGSYTIDASGMLANGNYVLTKTNGTLTIDPRPVTVTADAKSKTYGDTDPALTWSITSGNLVGGDTLTGSLARAAGENAGSYAIDASGLLANGNYILTRANGTLAINPRPITVTADAKSKTYGEADPTLTWHLTGGTLVGGDTLNGSLDRVAGENVGSYAIVAGNIASSNYLVTVKNGTLRIDPRPITVAPDSLSKTYGEVDPALTWHLIDGRLVAGDTLGGSLSRTAGENVGQYAISAGSLGNGNYHVTVQDGTLRIDPRPITVTADTLGKTYGDADPALTWHVTGGSLVAGDTLGGGLTRVAGENVGQYVIGAGNLGNGNYRVTVENGTLRIDPRPITVTADALSKTYGNADPSLTWRVTSGSLVGSDTLGGTLTRAPGENVGSYVIDASKLLANGNYILTSANGKLTIDPRPITVTVDAKSKPFGGADPALTWRVTSGNLVGSDTLNGTLTRAPGENVGEYAITAAGLANGNYVVTVQDGSLTIVSPQAIDEQRSLASRQAVMALQAAPVPAGLPAAGNALAPASGTGGNGGLVFVQASAGPQQELAATSGPGAAGAAESGRDPFGFMRVFVVNGGIHLPPAARAQAD